MTINIQIDIESIDRAVREVEVAIDEAVTDTMKRVALQVDRLVVLDTPVDTGRARSNWIASIDQPVTFEIDQGVFDKSGSSAIAQGFAVISQVRSGQSIYISNNVPYIGRLNDPGGSRKTTPGFIQRAVDSAVSSLL